MSSTSSGDLTYGSLFTGVGGLDLAVEAVFRARALWHSEIDPAPSKVIERGWPGVPNLGDIKTIDWSTCERPDIICGGYPCQPFSLAGQRQGEADERHLWPFVRDAVAALRPGLVVLENVRGHLSLGFGAVLRDLSAIGYDAEWSCLKASAVGAPHQRDRLWIVARPEDDRGRGVPASDSGSERLREHTRGASPQESGEEPSDLSPDHRGLRAAPDGREDAADTHSRGRTGVQELHGAAILHPPVRAETWGHSERCGLEGCWEATPYAPAIERWERVVGRPAPCPTDDKGRLSPHLPEWMMGFPEGWITQDLSRTQALKAAGNAVCPQQAQAAIVGLTNGEPVETASGERLLPTPTERDWKDGVPCPNVPVNSLLGRVDGSDLEGGAT